MSDISVLSNQYELLVSTSDSINNSVIAFKKQALLRDQNIRQLHPNLAVSGEELAQARGVLLQFLENVIKLLQDDGMHSSYIPITVLDDYKQRLNNNAYITEDITNLIDHLKTDVAITDVDMKIFDNLLSILDNQRSNLFRKLRTARG